MNLPSTFTDAQHSDVLVVGSGIVGLAHAAEAVRRGLSVRVVERNDQIVGASVRNFGHVCGTAQTGQALDYARIARSRWLELGAAAGFKVATTGAVMVARTREEEAVLAEFAAERGTGAAGEMGVEMLTGAEAAQRTGAWGARAGAFLSSDLRVDPRTTAPALAAWLQQQPGVSFAWRTNALAVGAGTVHTNRGTFTGDKVVVALGHDVDRLFAGLAEQVGIQRCRLQMLRIAVPSCRSIDPALLTGTSMLRYSATAGQPSAAALRARIERDRPELLQHVVNLMLTQRPDGTLLVGDTHTYAQSTTPFSAEALDELLLNEVRTLLGLDRFSVLERWHGVYASAPTDFLISPVDSRTVVVSVTSGIGMTTGLGLAVDVFDQHLSSDLLPAH